jgi:hypothetical protein
MTVPVPSGFSSCPPLCFDFMPALARQYIAI